MDTLFRTLLVCTFWHRTLIEPILASQEGNDGIPRNTSVEIGNDSAIALDQLVRNNNVTHAELIQHSSITASGQHLTLSETANKSSKVNGRTGNESNTRDSSGEHAFKANISHDGCELMKQEHGNMTGLCTSGNAPTVSNNSSDTTHLILEQRNSSEMFVATEVSGEELNGTAFVQLMGKIVPVAETYLCNSTRIMFASNQTCYCDIECIIYRDCCVDAFQMIFRTVDSFTLGEIMRDARHWYIHSQNLTFQTKYLSLMTDYGRCVDVYFNQLKARRSYKMISACPPEKIGYLKIECEYAKGRLQSIPVTLNIRTAWQIVFRNIYCAMCHGVGKEDIVMWKPQMLCPINIRWNELVTASKTVLAQCAVIFDNPNETYGKLRRCVPDALLSQCNDVSKLYNRTMDTNVCHFYLAPVRLNATRLYRNIHCAYCDTHMTESPNYSQIEPMQSIEHLYSSTCDGYKPAAGVVLPETEGENKTLLTTEFSFFSGFSFKTETGHILHDEKHECQDGFRYDFIKYKCIPIVCPFGKTLNGGHCIHHESMLITDNPKLLPLYGNELDDYAIVRFRIEKRVASINNSEIGSMLEWFLGQVFPPEEHNISFTTETGNMTLYKNPPYFEFYFENRHLGYVLQNIQKLDKLVGDGVFDLFAITDMSISNRYLREQFNCPADLENTLFFKYNLNVLVDNDVVYVMHQTDRPINVNITRFVLSFHTNSSEFIATSAIVCSFLNCETMMGNLQPNEYWIRNGSLILNSTGLVLPSDRYEMRDNIMFVCEEDTRKYTINVDFIYDHVAIILQRVTTSLSIAALLLTIAIYLKSASVHTVHGKTLVSLSISLIVAQAMGLLQSQKEDIMCKIVAVVMHLGLLSAFAWMSMISYDMMRTFVVKQPVSVNKRKNLKRYINYATIGWGIPSVLVVVCIILDNIDNPMRTRYGADGFCFIANVNVFFVFYTSPHIISLAFNIVSFIITVYSIASGRTNPNRKKNDKLRFLIIYFKLGMVMGLTWIFAILASVTAWVWLWYLSLILEGLQGVFVFLAFALRSRIWREMRLRKATSIRFGISFSMNSLQDSRKP